MHMDHGVVALVNPVSDQPLQRFETIVGRECNIMVLPNARVSPLSVLLDVEDDIPAYARRPPIPGLQPDPALFLRGVGPEETERLSHEFKFAPRRQFEEC